MTSRSPGVVGAVLESDAVAAEVICDGHHVHPSLLSMAIRLKSAGRMMAITDGTAAAGLPVGTRAQLGDQTIVAGLHTATLENGTLAGSMLTMDGAFRMLVSRLGLSLSDASRMCSTTPAEAMKERETGSLEVGKAADLVVLSADLRILQTYVAGAPAVGTDLSPGSV
jgi:N-acetylglucosamine-6-phosphate deacetylase